MSRSIDFVVIGLGRFGESLIEALLKEKKNVIVLDINQEKINRIADKVSYAACLDSTNEDALEEAGVKNADAVIVAMGSDFESGVMTVVTLQKLGVSNIYVKASCESQAKVYKQLGIEHIIMPEIETGRRLATKLTHSSLKDFINLEKDLAIVQVEVLNSNIIGKTIQEINVRENLNVNIIAINRNDNTHLPKADDIFQENDVLYIITSNKSLSKIEKFFGK